MITDGTLVRLLGVEHVSNIVKELKIDDWEPDGIPDGIIGVCEKILGEAKQGLKLYHCRFPVNTHIYLSYIQYQGIVCEHFCGRFYEFELEEVL